MPDVDLARVHAILETTVIGPMDGILGATTPLPPLPGLTPEHPISASGLQRLLECPHRFLYERVFGWSEPASPPSHRQLDAPSYGTLFHRVAERFIREHGERFSARELTLETWRDRARTVAGAVFGEFLREVPLTGDSVRAQYLHRLEREFLRFLDRDWAEGRPRRFVAAEKPFGQPLPVVMEFDGVPLHFRGFIDRIDADGARGLIRDLKTGKAFPRVGRDKDPSAVLDVQIALYGLVARLLAPEWELPSAMGAAYVYTKSAREGERAFVEDFAMLETAARRWFAAAARLLVERSFPRTMNHADCDFCAFRPVCGDGANERSAVLLATATGALAAFREARGS
jgi:RecB family exonuclease